MKRLLVLIMLATFTVASCGRQERNDTPPAQEDPEITRIKERLKVLELIGDDVGALVSSEFKSCADTGALQGKELAKKICQIAQAATIEQQADLLARIQSFNQTLVDKLNALSGDVAGVLDQLEDGRLADIEADIASLEGTVAALDTRLDNVEDDITDILADITTLQDQINDTIDTLNTAMAYVEIGNENLGAGPLYESLMRRVDKTTVVGFTEAYGAAVTITGCTATSGSPNVSCTTSAAHGYNVGANVYLVGITGGRGLTAADLTGDFVLIAGTTGSTIVFTVAKNATQSGNLGGSQGSAKEVLGRAMRKIYDVATNSSDVAVRVSNLGNKRYNFIIKENVGGTEAYICYDITNHAATYGTINTGATLFPGTNGNIICK